MLQVATPDGSYASAAVNNLRNALKRCGNERKWEVIEKALEREGRLMCRGSVPAAQAYLTLAEFAFSYARQRGQRGQAMEIAERIGNDRRALCKFLTDAQLPPGERLALLRIYEDSKTDIDSCGLFPILPAAR